MIKHLLKLPNPPEVILLDDTFQHRSVKPGLSILLTPFNDLYVDDFLLPAGNLREYRSGAKRADIVVVTKSPNDLSERNQLTIKNSLKLKNNQQLYFSTIDYQNKLQGSNKQT